MFFAQKKRPAFLYPQTELILDRITGLTISSRKSCQSKRNIVTCVREKEISPRKNAKNTKETLGLHGKKYFFAVSVFFCGEFSSFYNYPVIPSKKEISLINRKKAVNAYAYFIIFLKDSCGILLLWLESSLDYRRGSNRHRLMMGY